MSAFILGHADPTGDDEYNKQLSGRRAMAIYALLLTRDVETWEHLYQDVRGRDNWKIKCEQIMLDALGFSSSSASAASAGSNELNFFSFIQACFSWKNSAFGSNILNR